MNTAKNDHVRFRFRCLLRQAQRVAHKIGNVLDFGDLIVVSENDRVELFLERENLPRQRIKLCLRHWWTQL